MAEYPMDLRSGLPRINQEVIAAARLEHRNTPEYLNVLAKQLAAEQPPIWDDLNATATKEAAGDPALRDKFMKFGLHILGTVERAGFAEQMSASLDDSMLVEEPPRPEKPRGKMRAWMLGHAALMFAGGKIIKPNWVKSSENVAA